MVESGGLENRCRRNPSTEGSNPSPSADAVWTVRRRVGVAHERNKAMVYELVGTVHPMATSGSRIQAEVDDELASAMSRIDPALESRSTLASDVALRGAQAVEVERARAREALTILLEIADGTREYDLAAAGELASCRDERLT